MALLASCIVADPPQYTEPGQTRPELAAYSAKPPIYQAVVIPLPSPATPTFTVPVHSEDAGEQLLADFFLDYGTPGQVFLGGTFIPPGTANDVTDRLITFPWQGVSTKYDGCHTVSILVAHVSSFPTDTQQLDPKRAESDAAIITWWVNVNPDPSALTTLVGCPSQQPALPTATP